MRSIILATIVSALFILPMSTIAAPDHHQKRNDFITSLDLTEQQQAQMTALRKAGKEKRQAQFEQQREQQRQQLAKFLNQDQLAQWDKQIETRKGHKKAVDGEHHKRGDFLPALDLSEQQQRDMKKLKQANREQMKSVRQAKQADKRAQFATILTADQMQQYDNYIADKKQKHGDRRDNKGHHGDNHSAPLTSP
jgi:Spy/CpxP family protein refolding chaperone